MLISRMARTADEHYGTVTLSKMSRMLALGQGVRRLTNYRLCKKVVTGEKAAVLVQAGSGGPVIGAARIKEAGTF